MFVQKQASPQKPNFPIQQFIREISGKLNLPKLCQIITLGSRVAAVLRRNRPNSTDTRPPAHKCDNIPRTQRGGVAGLDDLSTESDIIRVAGDLVRFEEEKGGAQSAGIESEVVKALCGGGSGPHLSKDGLFEVRGGAFEKV